MPIAPMLVGQSVAAAKAQPVFTTGQLRLVLVPPSAPPAAIITSQRPPAGMAIVAGGAVSAIA